ncbi:nidogen-1 isoform X2 [Cololabis saira]|uniref:nidogen-1 isoform X2 n=1 Tax=Cololabis saira TaxID=129043 RepID=UPI002AD1DFE6|nr:nidogen-1 isoform X2 [Cololabis saira]
MDWHKQGRFLCVSFLGLLASVHSVRRDEFFPFGLSAGDRPLEPGSDHTHRLEVTQPVLFYDGTFSSIFINTNGFVATTEPPSESTYLGKMPPKFGMIAALQGDLDTSDGVGKVFFRQDSRPGTLRQAAEHINKAFPEDAEVNPTHAVVITWVDIAAHGQTRESGIDKKRNTFQLVIASLETASYAIFLYARDGVQFATTPVQDSSVIMHAGFSKGLVQGFLFSSQGEYYRVTTEDEESVRALAEETNSGQQGVWVFEVGTSPYFSNVAPGEVSDLPTEAEPQATMLADGQVKYISYDPGQLEIHPVQYQPNRPQNPEVVELDDAVINVDVFSYNLGTCSNNRNKCSQFADCKDYSSGYCCHCRPGYYGNGIQCVAEGKPQRMNGKLNGRVYVGNSPSPLEFSSNDLHSYVVVNDGRSYVAISDIPENLGPSLQPLSALGSMIGWSFALEQPGFKNGFSIIGGEFMRQAEVTFLPGNEKLSIRQEFKGADELDHLVVSTTLSGQVPELALGSTVQIDPYSEIYQYSNNLITSSSTREFKVTLPDGSTETRTYQWRETITFQSCQHSEPLKDVKPSQLLRVEQVFVLYDSNNKLIRFAMSNKIGDVNGGQREENPCFTGRHGCDTNAVCRPGQGTQFNCQCASGFNGDGRRCYDIDECAENLQICGRNSVCNNQPGTFRCECDDGYQFGSDGRTCIEVDRPVDPCEDGSHDCDLPERAQCSYTGGSSYVCSCLPGYVGDGRACQDADECQTGRCHQHAECINTQGSFICRCSPGYDGDGFYCSSEKARTHCETQRDGLLAVTQFGPRGPQLGQFIPSCDENGDYEPMQCDRSTGQCWCVDLYGREIPGSRSGPGSRPMCIDHRVAPTPVGPHPRPDVHVLPPGTHLLFAQSGRIEHIPLEGYDMKKGDAKAVLHLPANIIIGVAYDCVEKMIYWTEITSPSISKASIQGGEPTVVIRSDLESPEGIAIDHLGRTMFWTDSVKDHIAVASLDGTQRRVVIDSDLVNPRAVITDPPNGNLYWSDWNREAPKIETSHMDGSNRRVLVSDGLGLPNGLTYNSQSSLLCWADAGTHKVECIHPDRGDRSKVLEGVQYPFGITSFGNNIYYTDWQRDAVVAVDRYSGYSRHGRFNVLILE